MKTDEEKLNKNDIDDNSFEMGLSDMTNEYLNINETYQITNVYKDLLDEPKINRTVYIRKYPKIQRNDKCPCGSDKKFKKCHGVNKDYYIDTKNFYKFPLYLDRYGLMRVYDLNDNFVFQFGDIETEKKKKYVDLLNNEIESFDVSEYTVLSDDPTKIYKDGELFIIMRGWGNSTGVGGYNLDGNTAAEIQDNFRDKLLEKLNNK